jgi:hypothetical protein
MNSRIQSADPTGWMQPDKSPYVLCRSREAVDASSELAQFIGGYLISLSYRVFANLMRIIIVLTSALGPTDNDLLSQ